MVIGPTPLASVYQRNGITCAPPYAQAAFPGGNVLVTDGLLFGCTRELIVPDLDEKCCSSGASGSIHDSEIHEQFYSPAGVEMGTR